MLAAPLLCCPVLCGGGVGGVRTWWLRPGPSHRFIRLQVVLLVQGVQDGQVFLHGWQVHSQVPVHADGEAALQLVALPGHQGGGKALVGRSGLQRQLDGGGGGRGGQSPAAVTFRKN